MGVIKKDSETLANLGDQFESNTCACFPVHPPEYSAKGAFSNQVKHLVAIHFVTFLQSLSLLLLSPSWVSASELKCFEFSDKSAARSLTWCKTSLKRKQGSSTCQSPPVLKILCVQVYFSTCYKNCTRLHILRKLE